MGESHASATGAGVPSIVTPEPSRQTLTGRRAGGPEVGIRNRKREVWGSVGSAQR